MHNFPTSEICLHVTPRCKFEFYRNSQVPRDTDTWFLIPLQKQIFILESSPKILKSPIISVITSRRNKKKQFILFSITKQWRHNDDCYAEEKCARRKKKKFQRSNELQTQSHCSTFFMFYFSDKSLKEENKISFPLQIKC